MQTYWVEPTGQPKSSRKLNKMDLRALRAQESETRNDRLVDWIVEIMDRLIRRIIARRNATRSKIRNIGLITDAEFFTLASSEGETVLDEVREIVELPEFDAKAFHKQEDPETIELGAEVKKQLQQYVLSIASMYNENSFHNFEHAAHVTMSVTKLMSRIVAPDQIIEDDYMKNTKLSMEESPKNGNHLASTLHDHTYGITSDPLTQFACVFSSLIHDVDHPGKIRKYGLVSTGRLNFFTVLTLVLPFLQVFLIPSLHKKIKFWPKYIEEKVLRSKTPSTLHGICSRVYILVNFGNQFAGLSLKCVIFASWSSTLLWLLI
jgi:3'5'-cyclic nucleotide phosphodiesterase